MQKAEEMKGWGKFRNALLIEGHMQLKFTWQILQYMCQAMLFFMMKYLKSFGNSDITKGKIPYLI